MDEKATPVNLESDADLMYHQFQSKVCCKYFTQKTLIELEIFKPRDLISSLGFLLVFFLALSWVGSQQFAKSAITSANFDAALFTVWFSTCWMTLCFPSYSLFLFVKEDTISVKTSLRKSQNIFSENGISLKEVFTYILFFTCLWVATNYFYVAALSHIASSDATAIISSNVAIVYIMSLLLLKERFYIFRIFATLLSIGGVALFGFADGYGSSSNFLGVMFALISAFGSAAYKVIFKRLIFEGTLGQVSLFLSILGLLNAVFITFIFLIFFFTGFETFSASDIPWSYLCGSSALSLVFNFLVNFGVAYTFPLFVAIAMMLGIPLNALVDFVFRDVIFSYFRLLAALLIIFGFALMILPDQWNYSLHRFFSCIRLPRCDLEEPQESKEQVYVEGREEELL